MPLPLKAVLKSQFTIESAGPAVPSSSHPVLRVSFVDAEGLKVTGFYKEIDDTYPEILAKLSVAFSVRMRMALGKKAAEDRLVFDKNGKIIGTVSIAVPDFKPMMGSKDTLPADPQEAEMVCPSANTLLEKNTAELIVAEFISGNDDGHIKNFSLNGLIDHDMRWYRLLTQIIKGPRIVDQAIGGWYVEPPNEEWHITFQDIVDLPIVKDRAYWCAHQNDLLGISIPKRFVAYASFQALAKNHHIMVPVNPDEPAGSAKPVYFQEQLFHALLTELVVYDPEILRSRLIEYLGDTPVDFMALGPEKSVELAKAYPELFKLSKGTPPKSGAEPSLDYEPGNNEEPFVDILVKFFQAKYDEFYHATVHNPGCESNSSGVPVISCAQYLHNKPSSYRRIREKMAAQNKVIDEAWKKHSNPTPPKEEGVSSQAAEGTEKTVLMDAFCMMPESYYDVIKMDHRYHQVFRDAHFLGIQDIIHRFKLLIKELVEDLRLQPVSDLSNLSEPIIEPKNLTQSWQLMGNQYITLPPISADTENSLHKGARLLTNFFNALLNYSEKYYLKPIDELQVDHNAEFVQNIAQVMIDYKNECLKMLSPTHYAAKFTKIVKSLQQYQGEVDFQTHSVDEDSTLETKVKRDYVAILRREHTEPSIIDAGLTALFDWALKVDERILEGHIDRIITTYYEPTYLKVLVNRERGAEVLKYLKSSQEERGDNRLAFILSEGGDVSSSLNTLLIKHLFPIALKDPSTIGRVDINLMSLNQAIQDKTFKLTLYTEKAMEFAVMAPRFTHMHAHSTMKRINNVMYNWVEMVEPAEFKKIVNLALKRYIETSWSAFFSFSDPKRKKEVEGYFKDHQSNKQILALIFSSAEGEIKSNSLNTHLVTLLLGYMKTNIAQEIKSRAARKKPPVEEDFQWFSTLNSQDPKIFDHILRSLKLIAKDKAHESGSSSARESAVELLCQ